MFKSIFNSKTKVWQGIEKRPLFHPTASVGQLIIDVLRLNPNKIGQVSDNNGLQLTNQELLRNTILVANNLKRIGIEKGDVIAIISKNHHYLASVVFAAFCIAAPINTLDPCFESEEIAHMLKSTKPKLVFCNESNIINVRDALASLRMSVPIFTLDGKVDGARLIDDLLIKNPDDENEDERLYLPTEIGDGTKHPAIIICSSGTTGPSKGVCLSHATVLSHMYGFLDLTTDDVALCFSSLYWMSGFLTLMTSTIVGMKRIITTDPFDADLMLCIIKKYKVSVLLTPPSQLALLLQSKLLPKTDLSHLRMYNCGGSIVADELCKRINKYLPNELFVAYGLSEYGGILTTSYPKARSSSVGKLTHGTQVKLIDDNGNPCVANEHGEICVWLKIPFLGYYGDKKATENLFDQDGWMHTGDIGYFDDDGYLYIVDRKKDILKYMNYQISPSEIENIILEHQGVSTVTVVGIPDLVATDLPAAVIIRSEKIDVTEKEIIDLVKSKLSEFKQIRGGVYFVTDIPTTPSGKIIRRKVQEMAVKMYNQRIR